MKTMNNIIKKIDLNARVDYDTARCLMLMGMPQGVIMEHLCMMPDENGKEHYQVRMQGQPFYVTWYHANIIHKLVTSLMMGDIDTADKMCYTPTVREALKFLKEILEEKCKTFSWVTDEGGFCIKKYSYDGGLDEVDFEMARVLCYLGMPQGRVLSEWKPTKAQLHRYGERFYVTIYKTHTLRNLVSLNKGHDRDADAMCYAPSMNDALRWVEATLSND